LKETEANSQQKRGVGQQNPRKVIDGKRQVGHIEGKGTKSAGKKSSGQTLGGDDEADGDADGKAKVFGNGKSNGKIGNGVSVRNANGNSLSGSSSDDDSIMSKNSHETAFDVSKLKSRNSKVHGKKGVNPLEAQKPSSKEDVGKKKQTKKNRVWGDAPPPSKLDFTEPRDEAGQEGPDVVPIVTDQGLSLMDKDEEDDGDFEVDFEEDSAKERGDGEKKVPTKKGWFSSLVQRCV
jgi:signal recognition particle receptor subunit alpha